ncbi:MAG: RNase adapter RapZ [Pseudomonadota bacterium]
MNTDQESDRLTDGTARLVLITGPSGAGRSTAIRSLEDLGYEAIDNLPLTLIPRLFDLQGPDKPLALGIDPRNRDFSTYGLIEVIDRLSTGQDAALQVLYLDCNRDVLLRRFSETRRRHPLAPADSPELGIDRELDLLGPIKARADLLLDTSDMSPNDLRGELARWFAPEGSAPIALTVHSFSYKRGLPRGLDMVLDCRFLQNPYWDETLRGQDGRDGGVAAYVSADPRFDAFRQKVVDLAHLLLPAYVAAGKPYLAIGFGCTGGQHRSVVMAETLAQALAETGWRVSIRHRELERASAHAAPDQARPTGPANAGDGNQ